MGKLFGNSRVQRGFEVFKDLAVSTGVMIMKSPACHCLASRLANSVAK